MRPLCALLAVFALASIAGCASFSVSFIPYAPRGPTITQAVWAYPGDIAAIGDAGGEYVGTLQTRSRRVSEGDMIERMVREAATYGGTHVVQVDASTYEQVVGYRAIVTNSPGFSLVRARAQIRSWNLATFAVFYVPRERWRALPAPLQPF